MTAVRTEPNRPHLKAKKGPSAAPRPKRLIRKQQRPTAHIPSRTSSKRRASDVPLPCMAPVAKRHKINRVGCTSQLESLENAAESSSQQDDTRPQEFSHRPFRPYSRTKETREARRFKKKVEGLRRHHIDRRELRDSACVWSPESSLPVSQPMVLDDDIIVTDPSTSMDVVAQTGSPSSEPSSGLDVMELCAEDLIAPAPSVEVPESSASTIMSSVWLNDIPMTDGGVSTQSACMELDAVGNTHQPDSPVPMVVDDEATPAPTPSAFEGLLAAALAIGATRSSQGWAKTAGPATWVSPAVATPAVSPHPLSLSPLLARFKGIVAATPQLLAEDPSANPAVAASPMLNRAIHSSTVAAPMVPTENPHAPPRKVNGLLRSALTRAACLKSTSPLSAQPRPIAANAVASGSGSGSSPLALPPVFVHVPQRGTAIMGASGVASAGHQSSPQLKGASGSAGSSRLRFVCGPPASSIGSTDRKGKGKATVTEPMIEEAFQATPEGFATTSSANLQVPAAESLMGATASSVPAQEFAAPSHQAVRSAQVTSAMTATKTDAKQVPASTSGTTPGPVPTADVLARKTRGLPKSVKARLDSNVPCPAPSTVASTSAPSSGSGTSTSATASAPVDAQQRSTEASGSGSPSSARMEGVSGSAGLARPEVIGGASARPTERAECKGKGKAAEHLKHLAEWGLDGDDDEEEKGSRPTFRASIRTAKGTGGGLMRTKR